MGDAKLKKLAIKIWNLANKIGNFSSKIGIPIQRWGWEVNSLLPLILISHRWKNSDPKSENFEIQCLVRSTRDVCLVTNIWELKIWNKIERDIQNNFV